MSRRRSKETVEFVIRAESTVPEEREDNKKKKKKKKKDGNKKLGEKGRNGVEQKRKGSTLHTIIEEEELEDLNNNVCSKTKKEKSKKRFCFFGRKNKAFDKVDSKQVINDQQWHAGWAFLIRSTCSTEAESKKKIIVSTEYDTVDCCTTSVCRAEDDELLHAYRKRPRRNAVCEAGIGDEERKGLKRVLTHYCQMVCVDKYGLG